MTYVKNLLHGLVRRRGKSPTEVHEADAEKARLAGALSEAAEELCDYLAVVDEHLWMLLAHVEAVIRDLESRYGYIRLQMLVAALHKRARELGTDGAALKGLAVYIDSIAGATGGLFDIAVEDGRSAMALIEQTIGY